MTTTLQGVLFPMPAVGPAVPVTLPQLELLTRLLLEDGRPPARVNGRVLRVLIDRRWVERIGNAPAVYRVTPYGAAVRARG